MFWKHGTPWAGKCAVILAQGPSLRLNEAATISNLFPTIAIKDTFVIAPEAKVIFGSDLSWWFRRWREWPALRQHRGIKVALYAQKLKTGVTDLKYLECASAEQFVFKEGAVASGANSGHQALNLCVNLGARKIILMGYDMRIVDGVAHFHSNHAQVGKDVYSIYKGAMERAAPALAAKGIQVVNCSKHTALTCFPKVTFDEAVRWGNE